MNDADRKRLEQTLHDMYNALNTISMQTELAQMYWDNGDSDRAQAALEVIMEECRRCSSLGRDARDESRTDAAPPA